MKSKKDIKRFQEFLLNSWPAKNYYFLNGWILRFNDGITSRANSVFPVRYTGTQKTLDKDIDIVENAYKAYGLPSIFTMHDFHEPVNLKHKLLNRGYQSYDHTTALGLKIDEIQHKEINNTFEYIISNSRMKEISEFLARFSKCNEGDQFIIQKINKRIIIPKKCYMITKQGDKVIGTLLAVLIPQGYLYIGDVFVHPDYRRQDIATSMLNRLIDKWALLNGARSIWLQVEKNNNKALNLYCKIGMIELYNYYYMKRE
jgi:RimJ/RimL family protein N-acetyltransferase